MKTDIATRSILSRLGKGLLCASLLTAGALLGASMLPTRLARAADVVPEPKESHYYKIINIPIPDGIVLECGGMEVMPDGKLFVSTRRGDIYLIEGAYADPPTGVKFTRWATGMHEVLGLAYNKNNGYLYAIQRGEVTRLKDTDGRGHANVYETVCDSWGISGDYHEYAFMSKFDKNGDLWVLLTLTGSFTSDSEFRGWCMRIKPDGTMVPTCSGVRSPGGIGFDADGEPYYSENQGPWNGADAMRHLIVGSFQGHPIGNKWYKLAPNMGTQPPDPTTNSRIYVEAAKISELVPPAIIQPYQKLGQSQSGVVCDLSGGKFGPFEKQMFCADQHHSNIGRFMQQKVKNRDQGACILFRAGFGSGTVPMIQGTDGSFFVGGTSRGWGAQGSKEFALERLAWTGKVPFELLDYKLTHDGFDLTFTEPVDKTIAADVKSYAMNSFRYVYRADYGSPEVDPATQVIKSATVSDDGKKVHLVVDNLQIGAIHELHADGVKSAKDQLPLLHKTAWYTLWNFVD